MLTASFNNASDWSGATVMLCAVDNASDWIGIAVLFLAIALLATNDVVTSSTPLSRVRRSAEVLAVIGALTVIVWRFVVMT